LRGVRRRFNQASPSPPETSCNIRPGSGVGVGDAVGVGVGVAGGVKKTVRQMSSVIIVEPPPPASRTRSRSTPNVEARTSESLIVQPHVVAEPPASSVASLEPAKQPPLHPIRFWWFPQTTPPTTSWVDMSNESEVFAVCPSICISTPSIVDPIGTSAVVNPKLS
jgi:hypothetical protein